MTRKSSLNGSTDLLAQAMRQVFEEAMTSVRHGMNADMEEKINRLETRIDTKMDAMGHRLEKRIDNLQKQIDTTNENMQAQFARQEKKIGQMISESQAANA